MGVLTVVMRVKPVNPNTKWPNGHTLYLSASGGGKSQMLNQNKALPKKGVRTILWDPSGDHPGLHFEDRKAFLRAIKTGIKSGKGFRVAFCGERSVKNYEWWCEVVWGSLDGNFATYAIVEELSAVCVTAMKASPNAAVLLNEGRKYGLHFHGTSQKPQEISKTYFDQCEIKFVGRQKGLAMCKKMALEIGMRPEDIRTLKNLQFFHDLGSADEPELLTIKYKKIAGVKFCG